MDNLKGLKTYIVVAVGVVFALFLIIGIEFMESHRWIDHQTHLQLDTALLGIILLAIAFLRDALNSLMKEINTNTEMTQKLSDDVKEIKDKEKPSFEPKL